MKKKMKKILCLTLAVLILAGIPMESYAFFDDGLKGLFNSDKETRQSGEDFDPFRNVSHKIELKEGHEELCQRKMTGTIEFDWPERNKFYDIIFIQDLSGSFEKDIENVGLAINNMVNDLNLGNDVDGKSPKDRVMFQTFQGHQRQLNFMYIPPNIRTSFPATSKTYRLNQLGLTSDERAIRNFINTYYQSSQTSGGTPTIDGMVAARKTYTDYIGLNHTEEVKDAYNKAEYEVQPSNGGAPLSRKRETVYILITDGAANVATWNNLPKDTQDKFGSDLNLRYKNDALAYMRFNNSTPIEYLNNNGWKPYYYNNLVSHYEAFGPLLDGMERIGSQMRTEGGLGQVKFITGFWEGEDISTTNYGFGSSWEDMRKDIKNSFSKISGGNPKYTIVENNLIDFNTKLKNAFSDATQGEVFDNVTINAINKTVPGNYKIYRQDDNNQWETVEDGNRTFKSDAQIILDMSGKEAGRYKIEYDLAETVFNSEDYEPAKLSMTYQGNTKEIDLTKHGGNPRIQGNKRTDCDINIKKEVCKGYPDYQEGLEINYLKKQKDYFHFNSVTNFTARVREANDSLVIQDEIDNRLEILDAWILAGNEAAKPDAVSGATPKGILIAELKGDVSTTPDHADVPEITKDGNNISYSLEKAPKEIDGIEFPFGGYEGKDYILVVKVKLKDDLSDSEIVAMLSNDPVDNNPVGVQNISEVLIDGESIKSNSVKAIPPKTESPDITKSIAKVPSKVPSEEDTEDTKSIAKVQSEEDNIPADWSLTETYLDTADETFQYSIDVKLPEDTSGYSSLTIEDELIPVLSAVDIVETAEATYGKANFAGDILDPKPIPKDVYKLEVKDGKVVFELNAFENGEEVIITKATDSSPAVTLRNLDHQTISLKFKVKIKEESDLSPYYDSESNAFILPNSARTRANKLSFVRSNTTNAILPIGELKILKTDDDEHNPTPLKNAEFKVKISEDEILKQIRTDENGIAIVDGLVPGKSYILEESVAPKGYILDKRSWVLDVSETGKIFVTEKNESASEEGSEPTSEQGEIFVTEKNESASEEELKPTSELTVVNKVPETPTPIKRLKDQSDNEFKVYSDKEKPYKMTAIDEILTYQIEVPIESTNGYFSIQVEDEVSSHFIPDWSTFEAKTNAKTEANNTVPLGGNIETEGHKFTWTKTEDLDAIHESIFIEFQGHVDPEAWDKVFEEGGLIENKASVSINGGGKKDSNEVFSQITNGQLSLSKTVKEDEESEVKPLPKGLESIFNLYKYEGEGKEDTLVRNVVVKGTDSGPATTTVKNLDPGSYYFVETTAPEGYVKHEGKIPGPKVENYLEISNKGGVVSLDGISVNNVKSEDPTISKRVKGINRPKYSSEDYEIEVGETWEYAIDINIPEGADNSFIFKMEDNINNALVITEEPKVSSTRDDGTFELDNTAKSWLKIPSAWSGNPNHLEMTIPKDKIVDYRGKIVRLEVAVKSAQNANFLEDDILQDGKLPNKAVLYKGNETEPFKEIDSSTVSIVPTILRDVSFQKVLGNKALVGASFGLYEYTENQDVPIEDLVPVKDPFKGKNYEDTSGLDGNILFENVPEGTYWLVEKHAPQGTFLPYENNKIKVEVSGDPDLKVANENAVIFTTPDGRKLTGAPMKKLWNNELIEFPVEKKWLDDEGLDVRPNEIVVGLYRKGADLKESEKLQEATLSDQNNWKHIFKTDETEPIGRQLLKYSITNNEAFEYYVKEEEPSLNYNQKNSEDGHTITNTIKSSSLKLVKLDGDTSSDPIAGTTFILQDPKGTQLEATSNEYGLVEFDNLKTGVTYSLWEKQTDLSDDYIINSGVVGVTIDSNGKANFKPNKFPLVEVTTNEEESVSAYQFINYKKPKPIKKINGLEEYTLENLGEEVTYTIELPLKGMSDINVIEILDQVEPSMEIIEDTIDVKYQSNTTETQSIKDEFEINLSSDKRSIYCKALGRNLMDSFENHKLIFEFKAKIVVNPETFAKLHPEGSVPNTAEIRINEEERNRLKTNTVHLNTESGSVTLQKELQLESDVDYVQAKGDQQASFDLYLQKGQWDDAEDRPEDDPNDVRIGSYTTDENGQIKIDKLISGTYRFKETKAPDQYKLMGSTIEFTVDEEDKNIELTAKNKHIDLPTLTKRVRQANTDDSLAEQIELPNWQTEFEYVVDVEIPEKPAYSRYYFEDILPLGIDLVEDKTSTSEDPGYAIETKIGTGTGDDFVEDPVLTEGQFNKVKLKRDSKLVDGEHRRLYVDSDENTETGPMGVRSIFRAMQGKTFRYIYKVKINPEFTNIGQLTVDENGYLVNKGVLKINNTFKLSDEARVKPTDQYGIALKKIADFKDNNGENQPLSGAVFELQKHPDGPELPSNITKQYSTDDNGYAYIDKKLIPGKYILREKTSPTEYVVGDKHYKTQFSLVHDYYVLEVGVDLDNGEKGVSLTGVLEANGESQGEEVYKGKASKEDPIEVINRQRIRVPVEKIWDDEDDRHGMRPNTVDFVLFRKIVKGEPDIITGSGLAPVEGDEADVDDTEFNEASLARGSAHYKTWVDGSGIFYFSTDETYRYSLPYEDENGHKVVDEYNYYVQEVVYDEDNNLVEVGPPPGYKVDYKEVDSDPSEPAGTTRKVVITNSLKSSKDFEIIKLDNSEDPQAIDGAKFNLTYTNAKGQTIVQTLITEDGGRINLGSLGSNRSYTLKEIEAPAGYLKNPTTYTIVVDEEGVPTVRVGEDELTDPDFRLIEATEDSPAKYSLRVVDEKLTTPEPVKTVNDKDDYQLETLTDELVYKISVPVGSTEGLTEFVLEDIIDPLLTLVDTVETVNITADGKDVKSFGELTIADEEVDLGEDPGENRTVVRFTMTDNFERIAYRDVVLTFKAKVNVESIEDLKTKLVEAGLTAIPNKTTVKFNDQANSSNQVKVTPGPESEAPSLDKKVNDKDLYNMKTHDEVVHYSIKSKVPANVLGYQSIVLTDNYDKALEVQGEIQVNALTYSADGETLESTERIDPASYSIEHIQPVNEEGGNIVLTLGDKFNFTALAGKTLELSFDAKVNPDVDISDYEGLKVPNSVKLVFNNDEVNPKEKIVHVIPPTEPKLEKKVNGEKEITLVENYDNPLVYTIEATVPYNVEKMDSFTIEDTFSEALTISTAQSPKLVVDEVEKPEGIQLITKGQQVQAVIDKEKLADFAGKTVKLIVETKLGANGSWKDYVEEGGIDNEATLTIPNKPVISSNAKVKVPLGQITLVKTVDGEAQEDGTIPKLALPAGTSASFDLYQQKGIWDDAEDRPEDDPNDIRIGSYSTAKNASGQDIIHIAQLEVGNYYLVETVAPSGYVLDKTPRHFTIGLDEERQPIATAGEGFNGSFTVNNTTSSTPPVTKSVEEKDLVGSSTQTQLDLSARDKIFSYKVEVPVSKVDGWTEFTLVDQVDEELEPSNIKISIQDTANPTGPETIYELGSLEDPDQFTLDNNLITFKFTQQDKVQALLGKTVILTFDAQVKNMEAFLRAHPEAKVGNQATIDIGQGPRTSNKVDVTVPLEKPSPVKSINGQSGESPYKLGHRDQTFFYDIRVPLPKAIRDYEKLVLTDTLVDPLLIDQSKIKVYVNDRVDESLS